MEVKTRASRFAVVLLSLLLLISFMPQMAFADDGESDAAAEAKVYIEENLIQGENKIIINGGTAVTKSADGLTYDVGLKTPSGSDFTSLNFRQLTTPYKYWWTVEENGQKYFYKDVSTGFKGGSYTIVRPSEEDPFTITMHLYAAGTTEADITSGTATELASQDFTINLAPEVKNPSVSIVPVDKDTKEAISGATIELKTSGWSTVSPVDGKYTMTPGENYYLTIKADGYKDYSMQTISVAAGTEELKIELTPIVLKTITFDVKDKNGTAITDATIRVTKSYSPVSANEDGSYSLNQGETYTYRVSKTGYTDATGSFTVSGDETISCTLQKNITSYNVTFVPKRANGTTISNASIIVTYEDYDYFEDEYIDEDVSQNADGSFTLSKSDAPFTVTVKAEGFETNKFAYTPSGDEEVIEKDVMLTEEASPDKDNLEAIAKIFNAEIGALRPSYLTDKNINAFVLEKIQGYSDVDAEGVIVTLKSSNEPLWIASDGTINYNTGTIDSFGMNYKNVSCEFTISKGTASVDLDARTATIGWDQDYVYGKMTEETKDLGWDTIKGANENQEALESDLTLPKILTSSARTAWAEIEWSSSNTDVIAIEKTGYDTILDPFKGTVIAQEEDTEVTLTATVKVNENILNTHVEKAGDFKTITKEIKVIVKGTKVPVTEEDLRELLKTYYLTNSDAAIAANKKPYENFTGFASKEVLDFTSVDEDIQLPRYTRLKDENDAYVFANREIQVTYEGDDAALNINGYRVNVDRFVKSEDWNTKLKVTFTRDGVSVTEEIPMTIKAMSDELDAEIAMMKQAKAHYWDGLNNDANTSKDNVVNNLHAFQEMTLSEAGDPVWIYNASDMTHAGIIADSYFDGGSLEFETAGYNKFKSSNKEVIAHENLLVTRGENDEEVTISSILSSEKYGQYASKYPNNEKLQKLYKQEVSVTVTVKGTAAANKQLENAIAEAQELLASVIEGTEPGQYPEGTKDSLTQEIQKAQEVRDKSDATDEEKLVAAAALNEAVQNAKNSQVVEEIQASLMLTGLNGTKWLAVKDTKVKKGSTAMDLVRSLLGENGYTIEGGSYISAVTSPSGERLAAMEQGDNSGWMYKVNGKAPDVMMDKYTLTDGDDVFFFFTTDYTQPDPEEPSYDDSETPTNPTTPTDPTEPTNPTTPTTPDDGGNSDQPANPNATTPTDDQLSAAKVTKSLNINATKISTKGNFKKKQMYISFKKVKNATNYRIAYRKASAKKWTYRWTNGKTTTTLSKLKNGGLYEFKLQAVANQNGTWTKGAWSKVNYRYYKNSKAKVTVGKKAFTVKATKVTGASGYQVIYSTKSNLTSAKKKSTKGYKKTTIKVSKLKSKKTYYVAVRPYKKYKGHTYIGIYSGKKKVKTK